MALTLTYDSVLARVRIAGSTYLNANPYFETNAAGWTGADGTLVRSTAQAHEGVASLLLTPNGVGPSPRAEFAQLVPVTVGETYRVSAWVRCAVARAVEVQITWFTAVGGFITASSNALAGGSVAANTWTFASNAYVAPAGADQASIRVRMTGTPPSSNTLHIDEAMIEPVDVVVERSTDQVRWTTVRGGAGLPTGAISLDDYEFTDRVPNYYRVSGQSASITPTLGGVFIKSLARPFLNRQATILDYSDVERPARNGVFDVVGRSYPVSVSDVRGSRRWTLEVLTETLAEAKDFDLVLASGDPLLIHVPADCDVPGGYVVIGDTNQRRTARKSIRRVFSLPCTEVAAPGPDVVGATLNWQTVLNNYATWQDVITAHATWADLLELIGDPEDVIVP